MNVKVVDDCENPFFYDRQTDSCAECVDWQTAVCSVWTEIRCVECVDWQTAVCSVSTEIRCVECVDWQTAVWSVWTEIHCVECVDWNSLNIVVNICHVSLRLQDKSTCETAFYALQAAFQAAWKVECTEHIAGKAPATEQATGLGAFTSTGHEWRIRHIAQFPGPA